MNWGTFSDTDLSIIRHLAKKTRVFRHMLAFRTKSDTSVRGGIPCFWHFRALADRLSQCRASIEPALQCWSARDAGALHNSHAWRAKRTPATHTCPHIPTCACSHTCPHAQVCTHAHTHACNRVHTHMCARTCFHSCPTPVHTPVHAPVHTIMPIPMPSTHVCTHACMHM